MSWVLGRSGKAHSDPGWNSRGATPGTCSAIRYLLSEDPASLRTKAGHTVWGIRDGMNGVRSPVGVRSPSFQGFGGEGFDLQSHVEMRAMHPPGQELGQDSFLRCS